MIIFHNIKWRNLLSTGNQWTEIQLDRSKTTLMIGENGAGKTTLLDALTFVLYGVPFRQISKDRLVNFFTKKEAEVVVHFTIDGSKYMIRRGIKPNVFEIYRNDTLIPQTASVGDYQEVLESEILRMNLKSFKQIVVLGARNYVPFMELKQDVRRSIVEDIIDLQIFSTMNALLKGEIEETRSNIKELTDNITFLKGQVQLVSSQINSKHVDNEHLIEDFNARKKIAATQILALYDEIKSLQQRVVELDAEITDHNDVQKKISSYQDIERGIDNKLRVFHRDIHFLESNEKCPTCNQPIDEHFKADTLHQYSVEAEKLSTALKGVGELQAVVSERLLAINAAVQTKLNIGSDIGFKQQQIDIHRQSIAEIDEQITAIQNRQSSSEWEDYAVQLQAAVAHEVKIHNELLKYKELQEYAAIMLKDTGIKARIVKRYIPVINQLINKYLTAMNFFVTFELDENFSETIKTPNMELYQFQNFSEGEKMRINLAILFSWRDIARMRNSTSTNLLIMDELFDSSLDNQGVEDFVEIVEELTGNTNLFIISHKSQMFDKFRSVIKFEKIRNFSHIVAEDALS